MKINLNNLWRNCCQIRTLQVQYPPNSPLRTVQCSYAEYMQFPIALLFNAIPNRRTFLCKYQIQKLLVMLLGLDPHSFFLLYLVRLFNVHVFEFPSYVLALKCPCLSSWTDLKPALSPFIFMFSAIRLAATRKLTPAGPLLGLSICALAIFISAYLHDKL